MAYVIKDEGKSFKPAPEGLFQAVCCDVVDLGDMANQFKPGTTQAKVRLVWQIEETDPEFDNKPFVASRMYTASLNEKATLRKHLESWRGRKFSADELKGFDVEVLLGVNCQINIVHFEKDGKTYANVETIVPAPKGVPKISVRDYVRVKDRDPKDSTTHPGAIEDEDVPF